MSKRLFLLYFVKLAWCYWFFDKKSVVVLLFACFMRKVHSTKCTMSCVVLLSSISVHSPGTCTAQGTTECDHLGQQAFHTVHNTQILNRSSEKSQSLSFSFSLSLPLTPSLSLSLSPPPVHGKQFLRGFFLFLFVLLSLSSYRHIVVKSSLLLHSVPTLIFALDKPSFHQSTFPPL